MPDGDGQTWNVESLRLHLLGLMEERDVRYEQRFAAQEQAVSAALTSAERAVAKAEAAAERRFEAVNEFRGQLADQATRLMPREEATARIDALRERLDLLATRFERGEGKSSGLQAGWGYLVGAAGFVSALVGLAIAFAAH